MNRNNFKFNCYNQYCAYNRDNKCIRIETSLNKIGVCEDMFLINAKNIENLEDLKLSYLKNMFKPTDEIMQNDVDWFLKHLDIKEIPPIELILEEAKKLVDNNQKRANN